MPTKIVVNCATGQSEEIELTASEVEQLEQDRNEAEALEAERLAEQAQKEADRASAIETLKGLGLTEAQISALL